MRKRLQVLSVFVLLVFIAQLAGCVKKEERGKVTGEEVINVYVSILPQADLVRKIGGEQVEVSVLIPSGASPEEYELSPEEVKELSKADIYFIVGHLPVEKAWLARIKSVNQNLLIVDTSEGIEIIDDNPHIWLSPRLAVVQAQNMLTALSNFDDENKAYYEENYAALENELKKIDQDITDIFARVKTRMFLTYHPAWTYLARDYNLEELAIEEHGKEPGAKDIARIVKLARENGIKTVFATPQHSTKSAETIAREIGGEVKIIDPLPADYSELLKTVLIMAKAMGYEQNKDS